LLQNSSVTTYKAIGVPSFIFNIKQKVIVSRRGVRGGLPRQCGKLAILSSQRCRWLDRPDDHIYEDRIIESAGCFVVAGCELQAHVS
jgi:hypothetical protein